MVQGEANLKAEIDYLKGLVQDEQLIINHHKYVYQGCRDGCTDECKGGCEEGCANCQQDDALKIKQTQIEQQQILIA